MNEKIQGDTNGGPVKIVCIPETLGRIDEPPSSKGIDVYIQPGSASRETIRGVLEALDALQVAHGGIGLRFEIPDEEKGD